MICFYSIGRFRQRFTFVSPANGDLYAYLDALKVADTAMFVLSAEAENDGMDNAGEMLLTAILAQGLPSPIVTLTHLENLPVKVDVLLLYIFNILLCTENVLGHNCT